MLHIRDEDDSLTRKTKYMSESQNRRRVAHVIVITRVGGMY